MYCLADHCCIIYVRHGTCCYLPAAITTALLIWPSSPSPPANLTLPHDHTHTHMPSPPLPIPSLPKATHRTLPSTRRPPTPPLLRYASQWRFPPRRHHVNHRRCIKETRKLSTAETLSECCDNRAHQHHSSALAFARQPLRPRLP